MYRALKVIYARIREVLTFSDSYKLILKISKFLTDAISERDEMVMTK